MHSFGRPVLGSFLWKLKKKPEKVLKITAFPGHFDIATSAAVTELRGVFLISILILVITTSVAIPVGFFAIFVVDSTSNLSAESISAFCGTVA